MGPRTEPWEHHSERMARGGGAPSRKPQKEKGPVGVGGGQTRCGATGARGKGMSQQSMRWDQLHHLLPTSRINLVAAQSTDTSDLGRQAHSSVRGSEVAEN